MWPSFLTNALIYAAFLALVIGAPAVFLSVHHVLQRGRRAQRDTKQDLVNMMILFQTMRDIVEQQKDLARALNRSLDKKVAYIRDTVDTALGDVQALRDSVKDLSQLVVETRYELNRIREQSGELALGPSREVGSGPDRADLSEERPRTPEPEEPERPVLQVLAKPMEPAPKDDVIDAWVGLDFGGDVPDPNAFDVPEEIPETADDADAAREAFRALLNLDPQPAPAKPLKREGAKVRQDQGRGLGGNGKLNALHARVYEYSDAGMSVTQIARELGLGRGEVRLILGLRKDRDQ